MLILVIFLFPAGMDGEDVSSRKGKCCLLSNTSDLAYRVFTDIIHFIPILINLFIVHVHFVTALHGIVLIKN